MKNLIPIILLMLFSGNSCFAEGEIARPEMVSQTISLERAANQLVKDENNRILGAETEQINDRPIHVIKVLTGQGHIRHFKFDAETGQLID
ncbi:MAG: hypothetical protein WAW36_05975 [Methylovulum miyakonense]|uniref:PepSY domain-containing protein n=1 Tax=Methylovulum miyakonense TaxID=645578 RepID=UPI003BB56366